MSEPEETKQKRVTCINTGILPGNDMAPKLVEGETYTLEEEYTCKCGEIHYNVGIPVTAGTVSCYKKECREVLPKSGKIHWCHSSRFE